MYLFFRDLAIILIAAKFFGLIARKLKAPQVVGEIIAGLLIGPSLLGVVQLSDTISVFAERPLSPQKAHYRGLHQNGRLGDLFSQSPQWQCSLFGRAALQSCL